ncbi:MAG: PEP-CTERM system TPR-repeat protein PrsT, partial [Gammaproteobacteria bacterium]|nr:PEP-CTERM system TPR-repeat protein PrsT [Gammaproteobacteria bacterium]
MYSPVINSIRIACILSALWLTACGHKKSESEYLAIAQQKSLEGKVPEAIIALKNALLLKPDNAQSRVMLAEAYIKVGDGESAIKELERARALGVPQEQLVLSLSEAQLLLGKFPQVVDALKSASETLSVRRQVLLGTAYLGMAKLVAADQLFNAALAQDSKSVEAWLGRARVALANNDLEKVKHHVDAALNIDANSLDGGFMRAELAFMAKNYSTAETIYLRLLQLSGLNQPKKFTIYLALVRTTLAQKKLEEADKYLASVLEIAPRHPAPNFLRATVAMQRQQYDSAKQYLELVLTTTPDHRPAQLLLGEIHYQQNNFAQAEEYLSAVVSAEPKNREAREYLAAVRFKQHKSKAGMAALDPLLSSAQSDPRLLSLLGTAVLLGQDIEKNIKYLRVSSQSRDQDESLKARLMLVQVYMARKQYREAIQILQTLPDSDETRTISRLYMVVNYINGHELNKAKPIVNSLMAQAPDDPMGQYLSGVLGMAAGDVDSAGQVFKSILARHSDYFPARFALAELAANEGQIADAKTQLNMIIKKDGRNLVALLAMARMDMYTNDPAAALVWLDHARAIDSANVDVNAGLTMAYLRQKKEEKIDELLTQLARDIGRHSDALVAVSESLAQMGRSDLAAKAIERLVSMGEVPPQLFTQLARVYLARGELDAAL